MPLKEEMQYILLFYQSKNIVNCICISNNQVLPNSILQSWIITFESIIDMELPTGPYIFCHGNGKAIDNSNKYHNCHGFSSKLLADN